MSKMKFKTPLFLAAAFLLVGCSSDTIVARPSWQSDSIIEGSSSLKDNKMKSIYDAIKKLGDTNSWVLTKVMTEIAETHIGKFTELKAFATQEASEVINTPEFESFVNTHDIYKADTTGAIRDSNGEVIVKTLNSTQQKLTSFNKIKDQYDQMVEDIYEALYNEIKGGSYSTSKTKLFKEEYFVDYLVKELYEVTTPANYLSDRVFLAKKEGTSWKDYVNAESSSSKTGFLQVVNENNVSTGIYDNYIERKILPELYKSYLTQTYIKQQRYSSLGRSYARKVNMVSITTDDTNRFAVSNMLKYFADTYITGTGVTEVKYDFEYISKAMIGIVDDGDTITSDLLVNGKFNKLSVTVDTETYTKVKYSPQTNPDGTDSSTAETPPPATIVYEGTKLGELVKKISQCCNLEGKVTEEKEGETTIKVFTITGYSRKNYLTSDEQKIYDELTINDTMLINKGVTIKERELRQTDYTKDGWYLKNGGLTDISSDIRDRLFNISTSTEIDDYYRKKGDKREDKDYIRYYGSTGSAAEINSRKAFVTMKGSYTTEADRIVLNEAGNANYYIIEVEEAANTSKLSKATNIDSYIRTKAYDSEEDNAYKSTVEYNKLVRDIVKANSSNDTYKKNANEYYLMISNIVFYDQSVYDYFKSQFPDLFK